MLGLAVFLAGGRIVVPVLIVIALVIVGVGDFASVKAANGTGG